MKDLKSFATISFTETKQSLVNTDAIYYGFYFNRKEVETFYEVGRKFKFFKEEKKELYGQPYFLLTMKEKEYKNLSSGIKKLIKPFLEFHCLSKNIEVFLSKFTENKYSYIPEVVYDSNINFYLLTLKNYE